jgi:hypothetical protein
MPSITLTKLVRDWVKAELGDSGFKVIKGNWITCGCKSYGGYEQLGSIGLNGIYLYKPPTEREAKIMSLDEMLNNLRGIYLEATSPLFFPDLKSSLLEIHSRHSEGKYDSSARKEHYEG